MKRVVFGFVLWLVAFNVFAQKTFERNRVYDVLHYVIRTDINRPNRSFIGETEIRLRLLDRSQKKLEFDAKELRFSSVAVNGNNAVFRAQRDIVEVQLPENTDIDGEIRVSFKYSAVPKRGISFQNEEREGKQIIHSAQVWTHNEPDLARYWFPSFDFPSDKATSEQYITAETGFDVIANGVMKETTPAPNGKTTWHYVMEVPHATYLTSFVIGKYRKTTEMYRGVPFTKNLYESTTQTISQQFSSTIDALPLYEKITGIDFPYSKYDQTLVAGFKFGGMENITATTLSDKDVSFGNFDFGRDILRDLLVHELAHSWFGNYVTCENWAELWLNEGFATYMEALYVEEKLGDAGLRQKIYGDAVEYFAAVARGDDHPLYHTEVDLKNEIFDEIVYQKGGAVLHTLRREIGDEAFFKGINLYLKENKFGSVTTLKLKSAMERASKKDLTIFFDQWIYGAGFPRVNFTYVYDAKLKTLKFKYKQNSANNKVFQLDIPVFFTNGSKNITKVFRINRFGGEENVEIDFEPRHVVVDPNLNLPLLRYSVNGR